MSIERIAVTADYDNGLDSPVSGHFGHCKAFIVSTVKDGKIVEVESVLNGAHSSCAEPVDRLASLGVNVLITLGMGMRPYMHAQQVGLTVVKGSEGTAGEAILSYIKGQHEVMSRDGLCGGGGAHQH
ncbi:dinitrogenase iron-molybdenum cofactor biosynthesis protein [Candidatus Thorarchaeota archaeon]|nr:MAG: dinitrogenase iron-molybdenum cofactor biosynthesis protein [Candidatus Thorarchaeota archaeon]